MLNLTWRVSSDGYDLSSENHLYKGDVSAVWLLFKSEQQTTSGSEMGMAVLLDIHPTFTGWQA